MLKSIPSPVLRQYAAVIIANFTIVHLGMHLVWVSLALTKLRAFGQNIMDYPPTWRQEAWIFYISQITGVASLLLSGTLMSVFGRKKLLLFMAAPRLVMCIFYLFAARVWMIMLGRALGGVADLMCLSAVFAYTAEVAGKNIRGSAGTITLISAAAGMMFMFAMGPYVTYLADNIVMTCIVVATYIPIYFIPESPEFLYSKGRTGEALDALILLRGSQEKVDEDINEYVNLKDRNSEINALPPTKDKAVRKAFILVILLSIGINLIGYEAMNFYLLSMFGIASATITQWTSPLIIIAIQIVGCCCTFFLTDRFGKKPILWISLIVVTVGKIGLGTSFILDNRQGVPVFLPLMSVILVVLAFNAGIGSLFGILTAELFEGPVRPYGVSCGFLVNAISSYSLSYGFPWLIYHIGAGGLFFIYAGFTVIVGLAIYFIVPETNGKTFAEIQTALGRHDDKSGVQMF